MAEPVASAVPVVASTKPKRQQALPWEQQKDENNLWYFRFLRFVALGPGRSISLVSTGKRNQYPVPAHWPAAAAKRDWRARATAFDEAAKKDPKLIERFNNDLVLFGAGADPKETRFSNGVYAAPEVDEDDGAEDSEQLRSQRYPKT